jgi:signal transduction histidine kinase
LFRYQNGKINQVLIAEKLLNTRIKYLEENKDTVLLLTTAGNGVFFLKNDKVIHHLTSDEGLASNICGKTLIKGDTILVCTNKGLSYFNFSNNICSNIRTYNGNNGLLPGEVLDAEVSGEQIFAITSAGFSIVPYSMQALVSEEPAFYITGIYNYKDEVLNSQPLIVPDKNNILKVKYTAITFNRNDEVQYQYKFDNSNWNTTNLTELIFPDLSPGNHTLLLRARKADSNWSKVETIQLYVQYPFYLSWWFITAMTLLASAAFVTIIIYLNRRRNRQLMLMMEKRSALNHERNRISADMHDDVGSDLSKISIASEFAKARLVKGDQMYTQLEKITGYAYGARKKMDDIIWALNPENDTLGNLIAYVNTFGLNYFGDTEIRFQIKNEITEGLGLVLNSKERRNLFLIVKELCTNVFKHSGAKSFTITFKSTSDSIIIETYDDGKGYEFAVKTSAGNGLQNITRRVNEIQGTMIHLKSDGGRGTSYQFLFPKSK